MMTTGHHNIYKINIYKKATVFRNTMVSDNSLLRNIRVNLTNQSFTVIVAINTGISDYH